MKRAISLFLLGLLALSVSTTGCSRGQEETNPDTPIEVEVNEKFTVVVASNPTTGYEWRMTEPLDESVVQFVETEYRPQRPVTTGSGGWDIWRFEAVARGETEITLGRYPPSGGDAAPIQTVTFTVIVACSTSSTQRPNPTWYRGETRCSI